ncbi:glycoside hydrolase family 3 protein [Planosporangium flavigriseum]|uniref:Hydrolase n=1 Tax=Planosporangium flavigriseum TaxID=373681 RepID=A0A8J3PM61_9ACTN|nr:glycoside hydrolase family 3 N-terminal domain-containing protein [Planosporangium flavigriseum]NJC67231.1 glycoside hydrolase family 3 protein [Planosporangium flavigriseum]GIG75196.1 hydrolase [Planosporangium flavigriseum]
MNGQRSAYLLQLADAVLQPGFVGTAPPAWLRRRLAAGLGGVALFSRNIVDPAQVAALTGALRAENPDVIVAIDEEAGDVTRLESRTGSTRPGNLALGAVDDPDLTEAVACELGQELAAAGITLNYAPDADVNSNADNPVIGVRSFGSDPDLVARHTAAWIRGLQSTGVAACAKHYPGHGNTTVDSHHSAPVIEATRDDLFGCELVPFRAAVAADVQAIMSAHLFVPAIDPDLPATLSRRLLIDVLRGDLGFDGLIVSDGIEMAAVAKPYGLVGAAVRALAAGADAICVGGETADEEAAVALRDGIVDAVTAGTVPEARLVDAAERVRRLARWTAARRSGGNGHAVSAGHGSANGHSITGHSTPLGLAAARRAVRVSIDGVDAGRDGRDGRDGSSDVGVAVLTPLTSAPHVVEFAAPGNMAIGPETPWGLAEPLGGLLPGTTAVRVRADDFHDDRHLGRVALEPAAGRPLVLVVRDAHRHGWMARALRSVLAVRPDAVVVEMGVPAARSGRVYLATHGASRVNALAAAEVLTGRA